MRRLLPLVLLLTSACLGDDALVLETWTLDDRPVSLPGDLRLPLAPSTYRLDTVVPLPDAFRGATLTLAIPTFAGLTSLEIDRRVIPPLDPPPPGAYRATGVQRFQIPADLTGRATLPLTLVVAHRSAQSAWFDSAPRLSATPAGDAWSRLVLTSNTASNYVLLVVIAVTGSAYLAVFLRDRRRARHGWLALGTFCIAWFSIFQLGLSQRVLGAWDMMPFYVFIPLGAFASVRFLHAHLGRRASPWWWLAVAVPLAAAPFFAGPFHAMPWGARIVSLVVPVAIVAQLVLPFRAILARTAPAGTFAMWAGWLIIIGTSWPDVLPWTGLGSPLIGLQTVPFGFTLFLLMQALALAREHSVSLAEAEKLNAELRELSQELLRQLRERESDAERRRLFADLAHELGTPTSTVIGIAETLRSGVAPAHSDKLLELLEQEGTRLERLVGDVRLLAFLEQPDLQLEVAPCELADLADAAVARAQLEAPDKQISAEVVRPAIARVDKLRIEQVLANLLSNALRYAPERGEIRVAVFPEGASVRLVVEDSGAGVADEVIEKLGERFLRLDPSRTRRTGGHGLGLSIVTTIVQRHGGTIRFGRASLGGLGVTIDLPRR